MTLLTTIRRLFGIFGNVSGPTGKQVDFEGNKRPCMVYVISVIMASLDLQTQRMVYIIMYCRADT